MADDDFHMNVFDINMKPLYIRSKFNPRHQDS